MQMHRNVRNVLVGLILVVLIVLSFQNFETTVFRIFGWRLEMPLIGVVLISGSLGFALGKLVKIR